MPKLKIKNPCNDCPFRRNARPGWLGADEADNFVRGALADFSDNPLPCHKTIDYTDPYWLKDQYPDSALCAGALIFARNQCKNPRDPERAEWVRSVDESDNVFRYPWEFYEFHGYELPEDIAQMKRWVVEGVFP
jgi:hypothetical protein